MESQFVGAILMNSMEVKSIKLTKKRVKELIKDEEMAYAEYSELGKESRIFEIMARDEKRHAGLLQEYLKNM